MDFEIKSVRMQNYGPISDFYCDHFGPINLIIGENGTGKSILLKALYSAVRTMEDYKRGDDVRSVNDILSEKLRWTFQSERIGDLATRSSGRSTLKFSMLATDSQIGYQFSDSASNVIKTVTAPNGHKEGSSVFIPAKEVLSLYSIILKSREVDCTFGFDDTYYDLAKALSIVPSHDNNYAVFAEARKLVSEYIDGKVYFDNNSGRWYYKNGKQQQFSIGVTAEGIKKFSMMERLLANGYLGKKSVIFIDELESSLHPDEIFGFLDMVSNIAIKGGVQVFVSTHSYFVIKKLFLIALQNPDSVCCISLNKNQAPSVSNLSDGMPENSIIQAFIRLYEQEIDEVL